MTNFLIILKPLVYSHTYLVPPRGFFLGSERKRPKSPRETTHFFRRMESQYWRETADFSNGRRAERAIKRSMSHVHSHHSQGARRLTLWCYFTGHLQTHLTKNGFTILPTLKFCVELRFVNVCTIMLHESVPTQQQCISFDRQCVVLLCLREPSMFKQNYIHAAQRIDESDPY